MAKMVIDTHFRRVYTRFSRFRCSGTKYLVIHRPRIGNGVNKYG